MSPTCKCARFSHTGQFSSCSPDRLMVNNRQYMHIAHEMHKTKIKIIHTHHTTLVILDKEKEKIQKNNNQQNGRTTSPHDDMFGCPLTGVLEVERKFIKVWCSRYMLLDKKRRKFNTQVEYLQVWACFPQLKNLILFKFYTDDKWIIIRFYYINDITITLAAICRHEIWGRATWLESSSLPYGGWLQGFHCNIHHQVPQRSGGSTEKPCAKP